MTKAAKIFCVRGCLRKGVQLCPDVPMSAMKGGSLRSVLVDARLSTRACQARLSAAAPVPLATLCETPLRALGRPRDPAACSTTCTSPRARPRCVLVEPHLHARTSGEALRRRCSWSSGDALRDPAACSSTPALVRLERWYRVEQGMAIRAQDLMRELRWPRGPRWPSALCAPGPGARDKFTK